MKSMKFASIAILAALLGACSNQPVGTWYPISEQKKVSAVHQWGLIADDAAEQTQSLIKRSERLMNKSFYVAENSNSHFDRGFRNYMVSNLVNRGISVAASKEGAIEVSYETQVVRHGASFDPSVFGYKPGMATGGVTAFWVLREASRSISPVGSAAIAAAGVDTYEALKPTGVELLLTTSIIQDGHYILRNTDAYYIEKADAYLFEPCKSRSATGCRPKFPLK